jgi:sulfate transport system permease protein
VADLAVAAPRRFALPRVTAGLGPGASLLYLSIMVALPVAALVNSSATGGFWSQVSNPQARSVLELSVALALAAAAINVVTGVALAWVLVRDDFPGKNIVNALIDLPFALPTIVAGLVLLSLYGPGSPVGVNIAFTRLAVLLALLFVTLPFVTRAVQPVLLSLERDVEDAAACLGATPFTTFRRIILPAIVPAALTGASLAFARALGEFGSVVLLAGNLPHTKVAAIYISDLVENGQGSAAAAVSVTLLAIALVVLLLLSLATRYWTARRG